tara:strand:+ start:268 stop:2079 length:1812 start_codon:yes stop_codon:yes gene_type:complete
MRSVKRKDFSDQTVMNDLKSANGEWDQPKSNGQAATPSTANQATKNAAMVAHAVYLSTESSKHYGQVGYEGNTNDVTKAFAGKSGDDLKMAIHTSFMLAEESGEPWTADKIEQDTDKYKKALEAEKVAAKKEKPKKEVPKTDSFDRNVSSAWEHQPHATYANLTGERTDTSYQEQQNFPISGENKQIRKYSPFTIGLIPPKEITDLNQTSAANKDPYSWSGLGKLAKKLEDTMVMPAEDKRYFSSAWSGDSARLTARSNAAKKLDTVLSELSMLVYEGQISSQTEYDLRGVDYASAHQTPLLSVANVADIYHQLIDMYRTPPLLLLINPMSMNVTYSKIQAHQERTRYGYIFQAWGEQLPVINFSGRIGAFVSGESQQGRRQFMSDEKSTHGSGVQEVSRRNSPAYQNLMNLMKLYKNNAYIRDTVNGSQANWMVGAVEIAYDGVRYIGHFDKLEYTFEEQGNLGGINFSFDFTATEIRRDDSERKPYVTKMRNPNSGARFGDGGMDSSFSTMEQYRNDREKRGESGVSGIISNNDYDDAKPSWNKQVETPEMEWDGWDSWATFGFKPTSDGGSGWGTGGFQSSDPVVETSDFEGYNDPDDDS